MTGPRHQTMGTHETGTVDNICPRNAVSVQAVDVIGSRYMQAFSRFKGSGSFVAWGASEVRRRQRRLDPALGRRRCTETFNGERYAAVLFTRPWSGSSSIEKTHPPAHLYAISRSQDLGGSMVRRARPTQWMAR